MYNYFDTYCPKTVNYNSSCNGLTGETVSGYGVPTTIVCDTTK